MAKAISVISWFTNQIRFCAIVTNSLQNIHWFSFDYKLAPRSSSSVVSYSLSGACGVAHYFIHRVAWLQLSYMSGLYSLRVASSKCRFIPFPLVFLLSMFSHSLSSFFHSLFPFSPLVYFFISSFSPSFPFFFPSCPLFLSFCFYFCLLACRFIILAVLIIIFLIPSTPLLFLPFFCPFPFLLYFFHFIFLSSPLFIYFLFFGLLKLEIQHFKPTSLLILFYIIFVFYHIFQLMFWPCMFLCSAVIFCGCVTGWGRGQVDLWTDTSWMDGWTPFPLTGSGPNKSEQRNGSNIWSLLPETNQTFCSNLWWVFFCSCQLAAFKAEKRSYSSSFLLLCLHHSAQL